MLKLATSKRIFRAWVEYWEKPLLKINEVIAEVRLLEKYKDLVFYDPEMSAFTLCGTKIWSGSVDAMVAGA